MPINFLEFDSVPNFKKYIEQTIAETKTAMGTQMRSIDELKKKLNTKGKAGSAADTKRLEIAGFKVLMNPTIEHELKLMEETFSSLQERLEMFEKTKELFPHMTNQNMRIALVLEDSLPSAFMFDLRRE
jgi:hypothetical protein